jgi:hypothetical protein
MYTCSNPASPANTNAAVIIRAFLVKQPDLASVSQNTLIRGRCRPEAYDSTAGLEVGFREVAADSEERFVAELGGGISHALAEVERCAVQNLPSAFGSSSYSKRPA